MCILFTLPSSSTSSTSRSFGFERKKVSCISLVGWSCGMNSASKFQNDDSTIGPDRLHEPHPEPGAPHRVYHLVERVEPRRVSASRRARLCRMAACPPSSSCPKPEPPLSRPLCLPSQALRRSPSALSLTVTDPTLVTALTEPPLHYSVKNLLAWYASPPLSS